MYIVIYKDSVHMCITVCIYLLMEAFVSKYKDECFFAFAILFFTSCFALLSHSTCFSPWPTALETESRYVCVVYVYDFVIKCIFCSKSASFL